MDGAFVFELADGTEVLRLNGDHSVVVRGERVGYARDLVQAFADWVASATSKPAVSQLEIDFQPEKPDGQC
jgi:hypothetical protein